LDRLFQVFAGFSVSISNLTLQGGQTTQGGGIFNAGSLTLNNDTVTANVAAGAVLPGIDGGVGQAGGNGGNGGDAAGGGIYNAAGAILIIDGSKITSNKAVGGVGGRGGNGGTATTAGSNGFRGGDGGPGGFASGGGIYAENGSKLSINNTLIAQNEALGGNGGRGGQGSRGANGADGASGAAGSPGQPGGFGGSGGDGGAGGFGSAASGGGVSGVGEILIRSSTIASNLALGGSGAPNGAPGAGGDGGNGGSGGNALFSGDGGDGGPGGGGGDAGGWGRPGEANPLTAGGGVYGSSQLTIQSSTIFGNRATGGGNANVLLDFVPGGAGGRGGSGGNATGARGTGGNGGTGGDGGWGSTAIGWNIGDSAYQPASGQTSFGGGLVGGGTAESCTIVGNVANSTAGLVGSNSGAGGSGGAGGGGGRGLVNGVPGATGSPGRDGKESQTFSNAGSGYGGGVYGFHFSNSIVSLNTDSFGSNGVGTSVANNLVGGDPKLGPLQDNGGPTQTMALLTGSPAIGAGDPSLFHTLDQRGARRFAPVDIGAAAFYVWHNLKKDVDVDGDGVVAPHDLTTLILLLNAGGDPNVFPKSPADGKPYYDVDNDGTIAPRDLVDVILYLNAYGAGEGEGEGSGFSGGPGDRETRSGQTANDWLALVAIDLAAQSSQAERRLR
jgi:hypothetical protein